MDISRLADILKNKASSAVEDYSQLANAYPNLKNFAGSLVGNIERNVPTQAELENPDYMQQRALNYMSPMAGAIKASHGSPHKFESFDLSKIGTGEGAQAYGHGAYFGEGYGSPVAMQYVPRNEKLDDKLLALHDMAERRQQYPAMEVYEQYMLNRTPEEIEKHFADELPNYTKAEQAQILNAQKTAKDAYQKQKGSYLYDIDIKWPDPAREAADPLGKHHLLDWDVPLSEQPKSIQDALAKLDPEMYSVKGYDYDPSELGQMIYSRISQNPEEASSILNKAGIPGLKYLDQGSRGAGEGSHNIVMFGDEYPQIVSINSKEIAKKLRGK